MSHENIHTTLGAFQCIQSHLIEAVCTTFREYGVTLEAVQDGAPAPAFDTLAVAGIMGFGDERLRGCVVVAAPVEVLRVAMPRELASVSHESLRDLAGELANMLTGRIKNRLPADVALRLGCPITAIGMDLILPAPSGGTSTWHAFSSGSGMVYVRLDAVFENKFEFSKATQSSLPEGDVVLF